MGLFFGKSDEDNLYGSAKLYTGVKNSEENLQRVYRGEYSDAIILGLNRDNPRGGRIWHTTMEQGHALTFSMTRSGKGTCSIIPALITYKGSAFVLDPKGENAWITAQRRRDMGHKVAIIDPWNSVNINYASKVGAVETITQWNPLSLLDPKDRDFVDDIAEISDALILHNARGDSHWPDSARELVGGLIAAIVERLPGTATLGDMRQLLIASPERLAAALRVIVEGRPDSLGARKLAQFIRPEGDRELASICSTARTQLAVLDSLALMASMRNEAGGFDLSQLVHYPTTVYVVIPAEKLDTHGRWLRLITNLAIKSITRQAQRPAIPCLFVLDELGTIAPGYGLPSVERAFGLLAGKGIRIWGFFQSLSQLQTDYPQSWNVFIENSSIIQLIKVNAKPTADYFSDHMGTRTVSTQNGGVASRPVIMGQEIMHLPRTEQIVIAEGGMNIHLATREYFREPRFAGMFRPDPNYPLPEWARTKSHASLATPVPPVDWAKVAELGGKGVAMGSAAASAAAAFASGWVKDQKRKRQQAKSDAARVSGDTSEREKWAQMLREAKGPNDP